MPEETNQDPSRKRDSTDPRGMEKVYESRATEEKWLAFWLDLNLFQARIDGKNKNYSIVIPPPNVTGSLHMGHALNNTLQDILVRYKRMDGFNVLWVPGTDHAGIATQNVVERELAKEKKKRQDLGREAFIGEVWKWKEKHGNHIIHQLKRLGASCDWSRERFTMDEGLSKAVKEAFVHLYKKNLIFRDLYLINWCPRCLTALSDIEVEHQETKGQLWHIRYNLVGAGSPRPGAETAPLQQEVVIIATTRPETLLGDTAVAVHPEDQRYRHLIGQKLHLPLIDRDIPIIADHRVDRDFGTGAVKVTPAHDFNDFAMGNDHQLPRINILTPEAKMNENAGRFQGQDRFDCRKNIVAELEENGALVKTDDHILSVGHCYRCRTVVEPYLSLQWFVKTKPLAEKALEAVRQDRTRFHPENWTKVYEQWMENIKDWCISRQIWWGHRIPAWYCDKTCPPIVSLDTPTQCPECSSTNLRQEDDVLDTWFSSGLWPFSTLGWPEKTPELEAFYPTSVLITGFDIIFFWVARMMMFGLELMEDVPFRDVYIHALVRDAHGQKMSKSKGNVIDPLTIMDKFGTDAFRFTLAALAAQGRDVKLSEDVIEGYRNFCNKVWNASRFVFGKLDAVGTDWPGQGTTPTPLKLADQWILTVWNTTITAVRSHLEAYHFDEAAKTLYQFFWHTFCDWYLEFSKIHFNPEVIGLVLKSFLQALHPLMPFMTEEIWQKLRTPDDPKSIVLAPYPKPSGENYLEQKKSVEKLIEVITALRNIRGENRIPLKAEIAPVMVSASKETLDWIHQNQEFIGRLATTQAPTITSEKISPKKMAHAALGDLDIYVPLEGLVDLASEIKRLEKEIGKLKEDGQRREMRLADENFVARASKDVIEEERNKLSETKTKLLRLEETLENIQ